MKQPKDLRVLFLCKNDNPYAQRAAEYLEANFSDVLIFQGNRKDPLPQHVLQWKGDLLISFISSWIIPGDLLNNARLAAINFHPGSPEYPGTGCTNFAIYNGEIEYGVTAHHMKQQVDTGNIIDVKRFPISASDSVYDVTQQCYRLIEESFYEVMELILHDQPLPLSTEQWKRKPYTRKQLDALCEIRPDMPPDEIDRRIRATTYRHPWAFTRIGNYVFKLQPE